MSEWQPIETAPTDQGELLGCLTYGDAQCFVVISYWPGSTHVEKGWSSARSGHRYGKDLTHWMPLPPKPGAA